EWPPLYPVYLAAWQAVFGISGGTLIAANVALAGAAAFGWTFIFVQPMRERTGSAWLGFLCAAAVVVFVVNTVAANYRQVLAHNLVHALLPFLYYLAFRAQATRAGAGRFLTLAGAAAGLMSLLLLTHNSCVALLPGLVACFALCRAQRVRT